MPGQAWSKPRDFTSRKLEKNKVSVQVTLASIDISYNKDNITVKIKSVRMVTYWSYWYLMATLSRCNGNVATPWPPLSAAISGHYNRPAPPPLTFPPCNILSSIPQRIRQYRRQTENSVLGKPPSISSAPLMRPPPLIDDDRFQPVMTRNLKRRLR